MVKKGKGFKGKPKNDRKRTHSQMAKKKVPEVTPEVAAENEM